MKPIFYVFVATLVLTSCQKALLGARSQVAASDTVADTLNSAHPMADSVQALLDRAVQRGLPGAQVLLRNASGTLHAQAGFADIATRRPYSATTPSWLFSITKTYSAVLALQLWEQRKLDLDAPIGAYLDPEHLRFVPGHDSITVTMLLNHSSGLPNFTALPAFLLRQFNKPMQQPTVAERLALLAGSRLEFRPGTDYAYSNSNYLLLHLILERVSGLPYAALLQKNILQPVELRDTWFEPDEEAVRTLGFPSAYFDRHGKGQLEEGTRWNDAIGRASDGYGGIAARPADVLRFYRALRPGGGLLSDSALLRMQHWFQGARSTQPDYGLGIEYFQYDRSGREPQWGHEGDGIGCSTLAFYVPANGTYLYLNCNAGRHLPGPVLYTITDLKNELCRFVASQR